MILFFEKFLQFIFCKVRPFTSKIGPMRTILKNRVSSDLNSYPSFTLFKKLQKKNKNHATYDSATRMDKA